MCRRDVCAGCWDNPDLRRDTRNALQIDEEILTARIVALASEYGRYGYRRITAMLRQEGWQVNHKRVERIWRREGLKVPAKTTQTRAFMAQ